MDGWVNFSVAFISRFTDWYTMEQCSWQVFVYFVADRYSGRSIHSKCIPQVTDWYNAAGKSSYTLLLTDIRVYTSRDRPLYPGLLTDISGNSVADTGLCILCRWQIFWYTIQVTGRYIPRYWLTLGYSVADRSSYTLLLTDSPVYTPSIRGYIPGHRLIHKVTV